MAGCMGLEFCGPVYFWGDLGPAGPRLGMVERIYILNGRCIELSEFVLGISLEDREAVEGLFPGERHEGDGWTLYCEAIRNTRTNTLFPEAVDPAMAALEVLKD